MPPNLVINDNGVLNVACFGLALPKSISKKTYSNKIMTLWYFPATTTPSPPHSPHLPHLPFVSCLDPPLVYPD